MTNLNQSSMKTYSGTITKLEPNQIFVFGSNTQGRHGKGAALWAKENAGAIYGLPSGPQGKSYAIITKDLTVSKHPSISSGIIIEQMKQFYLWCRQNPLLTFIVAYSGVRTNLNGYTSLGMAKMFSLALNNTDMPDNIIFEENFAKLIEQCKT